MLTGTALVSAGANPDRQPFTFNGYQFVPLKTAEDFYEEGRVPRNCIMSRFSGAVSGRSVYYSMRKDGQRVATVQYEPNGRIAEIKAAYNKPVSAEVHNVATVAWQFSEKPEEAKAVRNDFEIKRGPISRAISLVADATSWTGRG